MKETKQKANHLIRMVALLAMLLVGVNVSWAQLLPTASVTLSGGTSTPFALVNTSAGKAIYGSGNQNLAYDIYSTAFTDERTGYCFVLDKPTNGTYNDNDYLLKFLTTSNQDYTYGGNTSCYLNSTSYGLAFVLGLTGNNNYTYGQDMDNGAVWTITDNGNGTYKLQNKATGKYLAGNNSNETGDNWSFCSLGEGNTVTFSSSDVELGTVAATAYGETISSGTKVAYGTEVTFTATPIGTNLIYNWSGLNYHQVSIKKTIDSDYTVVANFARGINISAIPNDSRFGNVKVTHWQGTGSNIHIAPNPGDVKFIATPLVGSRFDGWYDNEQCTGDPVFTGAEYTKSGLTDQDFTLWAKFTRTASGYIVNFSTNNAAMGSVKAYVNGEEIASGADVPAGTKVTFTATPEAGYLIWRWNVAGSESQYPQDRTVYERTVDEDCTITGEFQTGIHVRAYTNDANLGTVMIENSGKSATDFHVTTYPGNFTYKATEVGRGVFTGWYNNVDYAEEHRVSQSKSYTTPNGNQEGGIKEADYTLWANFVSGYQVNANVSPSYLKPTITIHQYSHEDWGIANHSYVRPNTTAVFNITDIPTGYAFDGWYNGSTRVSSDPSYHLEGDVKSDVTLVAKLVMTGSQETSADFTDRGKGGSLSWENGILTTSGSTDNWANIFVFPPYTAGAETHKNVTETADNFRSFSIAAKGDEYRVLVFYGAGGNDNVHVETVPASGENAVTKYYSLNKIKLPEGKTVRDIQRIVVAGTAAGNKTTFTEAKLYKDVISALDFNSVAGNNEGSHGGNKTWTVEGDKAIMTTSGTSWNQEYIYDFTTGGNMEGHSATEFTGIRVHSTGDRFRVIAYADYEEGDDANGNKIYRTFVGYVTNTGTGTEAKTQHFQWSELKGQWDQIPMTDADVARVKFIAVAGDNAGSGNTRFVLENVWLDNIKDYEHTFVCYGEEGGSWSDFKYTYTQNGSSVTISNIAGGDRNGENCIKIKNGETATINSPSANSFISNVKIIFADGSVVMPEIVGDVSQVVYTNSTGGSQFIAKIEYNVTQSSYSKSKTIISSEESRDYWLYVPASIVGSESGTYPVLFSLHGSSNDYFPTDGGVQNYNDLADKEHFIVVYPRGRMLTFPNFSSQPVRGWEATGKDNNDVQFMRDIIKDITTNESLLETLGNLTNKINTDKIYITGFSNGGMMAYAVANADPDIFAAYSSIAGFPINEMHQRTHNTHPVPFLHIHGTKDNFVRYDLVHTIVDNMLTRNGLSYVPTTKVENGNASVYGTATKYNKYEYTASGCKPFIYYTIGTGMTDSDTGLGHNKECVINNVDSKKIIWDFFKDKTLDKTVSDIEFKAQVSMAKVTGTGQEISTREQSNQLARDHGWSVSDGGRLLAQYGQSGGYTNTDQNVYHTIQLNEGTHYIKFKATSDKNDNYVVVRISKIGDMVKFNTLPSGSVEKIDDVVLDNAAYYTQGDICIPFTTTGCGEYMISFSKGSQYDNTKIENVEISKSGIHTESMKYQNTISTDFTGYYSYNNRLFAQWNFDLSDGFRFDGKKIKSLLDDGNTGNDAWEADLSNTNFIAGRQDATNGTIIYTYIKPLGTQIQSEEPTEFYVNTSNFDELTYDGSYTQGATSNDLIPVAAGLKFNAPARHVKVYVDLANGQVTGTHLVVDEYVKLYVPYVTNSYRNDKGSILQPNESNKDDFMNCMHHIHRDILYVALNQGTVWDRWRELEWNSEGEPTRWDHSIGHIKNKCIDHPAEDLFNDGGTEFVNGKNYFKMDYRGYTGNPCIVQFSNETVIDRLGVNRNLTYSFYTEYINEMGVAQPSPRMRIVGSPSGLKVANLSQTSGDITGAIAMTYGGWLNGNKKSTYTSYAATEENDVTDGWDELGVFNGQATDGGADVFANFSTLASAPASNVSAAIDGFPVISKTFVPASSGSMMPRNFSSASATIEVGGRTVPNYHPTNTGHLFDSYIANKTPWSLPSRGAYVKYEPSVPGVLNIDVVQMGGQDYYIADEYGKLVTSTVYSRAASGQSVLNNNGIFRVTKTDYVKHTLNVFPGKTYYIFSNTAGLGVVGFYFEPNMKAVSEYGREDMEMKEIVLDAATAYTARPTTDKNGGSLDGSRTVQSPTADGHVDYTIHYSHEAVKVTLNRAFKENIWNTICLPFSMNQVQIENVFGEGTRVILLRDIQSSENSETGRNECSFICHENQDIIAGYPYFILPKKTISNIVTNACLDYYAEHTNNVPSLVTVKSAGPSIYQTADNELTYGGDPNYIFQGCFSATNVPDGSYYINANDGKLYRLKTDDGNGVTINPYRVWMNYVGPIEQAYAKKTAIGMFCNYIDGFVDEETTGIDLSDVLESQGIFAKPATIYGINGQVVRRNATNLNNLPKGIYLVNGKKFTIK